MFVSSYWFLVCLCIVPFTHVSHQVSTWRHPSYIQHAWCALQLTSHWEIFGNALKQIFKVIKSCSNPFSFPDANCKLYFHVSIFSFSFQELREVRVAFQLYEHEDMMGLAIDEHILLRTLKVCSCSCSLQEHLVFLGSCFTHCCRQVTAGSMCMSALAGCWSYNFSQNLQYIEIGDKCRPD